MKDKNKIYLILFPIFVIIILILVLFCHCKSHNYSTQSSSESKIKSKNNAIQDDTIVIDPFCGLRIKKSEAMAKVVYNGQEYYFCLEDHKDAFFKSPQKFFRLEKVDNFSNSNKITIDGDQNK